MVVLSADHGSIDAPERLREQGITAERVDPSKFLPDLNKHLKQVMNIDWEPITADDVQDLYITSPGDANNPNLQFLILKGTFTQVA